MRFKPLISIKGFFFINALAHVSVDSGLLFDEEKKQW
jgi:hypothetical protein